jgi:hypothetical protein
MTTTFQAWSLVTPDGRIDLLLGAVPNRKDLRRMACEYRMGARDYERLGNDPDRWALLRKEGYRIVRSKVTVETGATR